MRRMLVVPRRSPPSAAPGPLTDPEKIPTVSQHRDLYANSPFRFHFPRLRWVGKAVDRGALIAKTDDFLIASLTDRLHWLCYSPCEEIGFVEWF
jgi:hypothetical protein